MTTSIQSFVCDQLTTSRNAKINGKAFTSKIIQRYKINVSDVYISTQ